MVSQTCSATAKTTPHLYFGTCLIWLPLLWQSPEKVPEITNQMNEWINKGFVNKYAKHT